MKIKNNYLKYIAVILAVLFLITASITVINIWENSYGTFSSSEMEDDVLEYNGKEYALKDNIQTFLVLGLDKYMGESTSESHESGSVQADFLMLFVFDNNSKQITAIHINRDTMTKVNRLDVVGNKIGVENKQIALAYNHAYDKQGRVNCRNTADSVSELLMDIKIDHYISLTMDSVIEINDMVDGVEVTVLDDFTGIDENLVKGEKTTLKGEQSLKYVRTRQGLEDSTNSTRMLRQQQYVDALLSKMISCVESDDEFILRLADRLKPYLDYDSTEFRLKEFAEKFDNYEFVGIREIEGESKVGEFVEFYPNKDSICKLVIDLFYKQK